MSRVFIEKDNLNITWEIIKAEKFLSAKESQEWKLPWFEYRLWLRFNVFINWKLKSFDYYLDLEETTQLKEVKLFPTQKSINNFDNIAYVLESLWYNLLNEWDNIDRPLESFMWKLTQFVYKFISDYDEIKKEFKFY